MTTIDYKASVSIPPICKLSLKYMYESEMNFLKRINPTTLPRTFDPEKASLGQAG